MQKLLEVSTKLSTASVTKKSGNHATNKRPRNEAQAVLPAFKVVIKQREEQP